MESLDNEKHITLKCDPETVIIENSTQSFVRLEDIKENKYVCDYNTSKAALKLRANDSIVIKQYRSTPRFIRGFYKSKKKRICNPC